MAGICSNIAADVLTEAMMSTESCKKHRRTREKMPKIKRKQTKNIEREKKGHMMSMNKMCTFSNRINYDYGLAKQDMQAIMKWERKETAPFSGAKSSSRGTAVTHVAVDFQAALWRQGQFWRSCVHWNSVETI